MKKFALVLSGNGVFDGAEVHETSLSMYSIMKNGGEYEIFAPDIDQHHVLNHINGEEMNEKRNVLIESARIARGKIKPLSAFKAEDFDVLYFPGGFGAAKNLCSFAVDGENCKVNNDVEAAIRATHAAGKPIVALCISPVFVAKILGDVELTIGQDKETAEMVEKMGARHKTTDHGQVIHDAKNNVFTTPCYMLDANILQIADGTENVVKAVLDSLN
jgi:enhancing lycopene biosynthesis protein 2